MTPWSNVADAPAGVLVINQSAGRAPPLKGGVAPPSRRLMEVDLLCEPIAITVRSSSKRRSPG